MYKTCATKKNTKQYYTPKCLISYLLPSFFLLASVSTHFPKGGKSKAVREAKCVQPTG